MTAALSEIAGRESTQGHARTMVSSDALSALEIWKLWFQTILGRIFLLPLGAVMLYLIKSKFRLKIKKHSELRRRFREITKGRSPLIICANHLTLVDSIVILWALKSVPGYFLNYRLFSWNIPARENYCRKPAWRLVTYLNKCIPIDRKGSVEHIDGVLGKLSFLLGRGDLCLIFPEGTRSRSGRFDAQGAGYGIGKLVRSLPGCRVLCVYQRGASQEGYSDFPKRGEVFHIDMEVITPTSAFEGRRAVKDCAVQVLSTLERMEERYFFAKR